ncbi:MAG: hypothetical protein JST68_22060 [Bacteroidetes bacterium]|nr:hypothetical protein [Bacteroidota bacterium]
MKKTYLLAILFLATFTGKAQLTDIYAGAQLYTTPFDGMQINNIAYYFRSDGTFNDKFDTPDWRTHISGAYTLKTGMVQLKFKDGREAATYKLNANGNLESTAGIKHTLHKLKKVASLPSASYQSKSASSRGGMGTGMPNVAAFSSGFLAFDGKGRFSSSRTGVVGVSGEAMAGKYDKSNAAAGTYTLGDGDITFTLSNGTTSKHSLFYSPPDEEDLILLDGEFYFREKNTASAPASAAPTTTGLPSPTDLLNKLRAHYGGESIDKLTTIKETSTLTGNFQAVMLTDITHNKVRAEIRQGDKLLMIKQWEGSDGWQWVNGALAPLAPNEKSEFQLSLYQGILGLHKKLSSYFLTGKVSKSGDDYLLTFFINNHKLIYLVNSAYEMKGNAYTINETPNVSVYKKFTQTSGITYPSVTESSDGKATIVVTTTAIEFNPVLNENAWGKP